ncbi:bile acid:sodium symporter family protein [Shewanella xiamenensis]|uniref:bile acid:sodium symporter family protein n=1 Tax=Shewanella xiamenensis TaxID=332186 RepID=UPI00214FAE5E|nr:bile acid:sodium symporter family protein [Shewanella xiamenensis]MCR4536325.1 bile acid:sodium symporter family protein [Shewanella xiamenensis]MEE1982357.1 bile acid:sodium symporter family protein [Shewanella xiamenensis]WHF55481.1 bile acid:sodium symporter family protein [Shewanella xiamenensis]
MVNINRFFPLFALLGAGTAYLMPAWFSGLKTSIVPLLVVIMLSMGLTLDLQDFTNAFKQKRAVITGLILQFTLMPLSALVISLLLGLNRELTIGMVLVGSVAGGTASNVICYLAKGDVALSITMTALSTLVGVVLTPLIIQLLIGEMVAIPLVDMLVSLVKIVLIPVTVGVVLNHFFKPQVAKLAPALPIISIVGIVLAISIIVALNAGQFAQVGPVILLAVFLHNGLGLALGYTCCRLLGFSHTVCKTISIEVGLQNSGLATALCIKFFSPVSAVPSAIFSIWHNLSGAMLAGYWASRVRQATDDPLRRSDIA